MGDFGAIKWQVFEKFLLHNGCTFSRTKGDHRIYHKTGLLRPIVVPQYNPLPAFIIMNNLRILGVSKADFLRYIKR